MPVDQAPPEFFRRADAFVVPRHPTRLGVFRTVFAFCILGAAIAYTVAGIFRPEWFGVAHAHIFYLVGPALIGAASLHAYLVGTAVRRPVALIRPNQILLPSRRIKKQQVRQIYIDRTANAAVDNKPALMAEVEHRGQNYTLAIIPPGYVEYAGLRDILKAIKKWYPVTL